MRSKLKLRLPSPALVVAVVALLVALSGTAIASGVKVPIPKLALHSKTSDVATTAKNALKLNGQTSAALVSQAVSQASSAPGPASTAAGLTVVKSQSAGAIPSGGVSNTTVSCDAGQTAIGGGVSSDTHLVGVFDSFQSSAGAWTVGAGNFGSGTANATAYAICLK
jgi:hypothetical protein